MDKRSDFIIIVLINTFIDIFGLGIEKLSVFRIVSSLIFYGIILNFGFHRYSIYIQWCQAPWYLTPPTYFLRFAFPDLPSGMTRSMSRYGFPTTASWDRILTVSFLFSCIMYSLQFSMNYQNGT